jgi:hypothetical protein
LRCCAHVVLVVFGDDAAIPFVACPFAYVLLAT